MVFTILAGAMILARPAPRTSAQHLKGAGAQTAGARPPIPMKIPTSLLLCLVMMIFPSTMALADEPARNYTFSIENNFDSGSWTEFYFLLGPTGAPVHRQTAYRSPAAVKKAFAELPRGATVEWSPSCDGESVALKNDLEDLEALCKKKGVIFIIHPSG